MTEWEWTKGLIGRATPCGSGSVARRAFPSRWVPLRHKHG
jgi:hypothetical protein